MKTGPKFAAEDIRQAFLSFFTERRHHQIAGASLLPNNDPTLLYINSGMAPLKRFFTGEDRPPAPDLCNVQPCIRTRDIEDVGDRHHLTFFEMLGSWSINNYFKERAIELAYELLIERFKFPTERIYVSVFGGDRENNIPPDVDSIRAWERVGVPRGRIVELGLDNFWGPAGDTGPCGPCTEVFFDTGSEFGETYEPGGNFDTRRRYIEIWNAGVFMQYDKTADGRLTPLPFTSVDTGSGLERMAMVLGGFDSVYETDLMSPILDIVRAQLGGAQEANALRRVTDHMRASVFILSEGVACSNEGRGYIPRRLLRRCVALATRVGVRFDYASIVDCVVARFGTQYPRLKAAHGAIVDAIEAERKGFEEVLTRGLSQLDKLCGEGPFVVNGKDALRLFTTYGMPLDIIRDTVSERGGSVDESGFELAYREHQDVSRVHAKGATVQGAETESLWQGLPASRFSGYETGSCFGQVLRIAQDGIAVQRAVDGQRVDLILSETCAYGESGGQVGDRGTLKSAAAELLLEGTSKTPAGVHVHHCLVTSGQLELGERVEVKVDAERRARIAANHTATHLLHSALRSALGEHVKQAGSLVEEHYLRFDFTHSAKLSTEQLFEAEGRVNEAIRADHQRVTAIVTVDEALRRGALALFGENYGESVRMISYSKASSELCGGTHVERTGQIGTFRITAESAVARGVRRIFAATAAEAVKFSQRESSLLGLVTQTLRVNKEELPARLRTLLAGSTQQGSSASAAGVSSDEVDHAVQSVEGVSVLTLQTEIEPERLREEAVRLADKIHGAVALATVRNGKAHLAIAVDSSKSERLPANELLRAILKPLDGQGGGKPRLAMGGGSNIAALPAALQEFLTQVRVKLTP